MLTRFDLGFEGYVMTDWNSYDTVDIPSAVNAGNCWFTPGSEDDTYVRPILTAAAVGTLNERRLRNNVKYLLQVIRSRTAD